MIEYRKEILSNVDALQRLNELGADGWDNYAVSGNVYLFKRVKQNMATVTPPMPDSLTIEPPRKNAAKNK